MIDHNRPADSPVPIIFLIIMNAFISSSFVFWLTLALTQLWGGGGSASVGAALLLGQGQGGGWRWRYHERFLHSAPTTTTTTTATTHPAQQSPGESFLPPSFSSLIVLTTDLS